MKNEGIFTGDFVIFRKTNIGVINKLVVIRMNGQLMVKLYKEVDGHIEFHSNDDVTPPLKCESDDDCEVIGLVVNVIKEY